MVAMSFFGFPSPYPPKNRNCVLKPVMHMESTLPGIKQMSAERVATVGLPNFWF